MADPKVSYSQKKDAPTPAAASEATPGKPKKPIKVWAVVLGLSLVLIWGAGFLMVKNILQKAAEETAAKNIPPKPKPLSNPVYILDPFSTNLNIEDGTMKILETEMSLEYEDEKTQVELMAKLPQVRDEIIMLLSSKEVSEVNSPDEVRALQAQILSRMNKILLVGKVLNVYFTNFVIKDKR